MNKLIDYLRERIKTVIGICYLILALVLAHSLYADKSHAHTWVEQHIPFFWSIFGFAAAAAIIGFARWYGHSGIMTREDYYDTDPENGASGSNIESSVEHV